MYADTTDGVSTRKIRLRSQDGSVMCGCRFKYIAEEVPADYNSLVKPLVDYEMSNRISNMFEIKSDGYESHEEAVNGLILYLNKFGC